MKPLSEMSPGEMATVIHQLKRMVRMVCGKLRPKKDVEFERASGKAICPDCGLEYFDHPGVGLDLTLHVACDGRLLKL